MYNAVKKNVRNKRCRQAQLAAKWLCLEPLMRSCNTSAMVELAPDWRWHGTGHRQNVSAPLGPEHGLIPAFVPF